MQRPCSCKSKQLSAASVALTSCKTVISYEERQVNLQGSTVGIPRKHPLACWMLQFCRVRQTVLYSSMLVATCLPLGLEDRTAASLASASSPALHYGVRNLPTYAWFSKTDSTGQKRSGQKRWCKVRSFAAAHAALLEAAPASARQLVLRQHAPAVQALVALLRLPHCTHRPWQEAAPC